MKNLRELLILVGVSGSGKTAVAEELVGRYGYSRVVTTTTRAQRPGEVNGKDYHFISRDEFFKGIEDQRFLEYAEFGGNLYGTQKDALDLSEKMVIVLEPLGVKAFERFLKRQEVPPLISKVFLNTPKSIQRSRMVNRGLSQEAIEKRIEADNRMRSEVKCDYDLVLDSSVFESIAKLGSYIERSIEGIRNDR